MINIENQRYGRLVAISPTKERSGTSILWECLCDCGSWVLVSSNNLRSNRQLSCGCWRKEFGLTHGMSKERIYMLWSAMLSRTRYGGRYKNHAGRGISVCQSWLDFENFYEDMGENYKDGLELDRIDVNGDYCKENCRWVDRSTQAFNKRMDTRNKSGKTGVYPHKQSGKWDVKITKDGRSIYLGRYETLEDAVDVRVNAELKYFGFTKP